MAALLAAVTAVVAACGFLIIDDGGDLVVDVKQLSFDKPLVVTVANQPHINPGLRRAELRLVRFPAFHTTGIGDLNWYSTLPGVADIVDYREDENGNIVLTVEIGEEIDALATSDVPREATIRAVYAHSSPVFAEATMMVIPPWLPSRELFFSWGNHGTNVADHEHMFMMQGFTRTPEGDWHMGNNGIFLLTGTGDVNPDPQREGGDGQGVFVINPDDPYEFGVVPNGGPRALGNLENQLRTAGSGMRVMRIMGLQAPFRITAEYASNDADPRWVDIRFGDTSGIRVEGPLSSGHGDFRQVSFTWDYYYDEDGNRRYRDDFVPVTFIEAVRGVRMTFLRIEYLGPR